MHWTYRAFPQSLTAIFTEGIIHNHNPCHTNNNNWITFISDNFAILDNNNDSQSFIFCLRFLILLNHYQSNLHIYTLQWWWFIKNYKAYPSKNWVLKVIDCYYVLLYIILKWISNSCMVLFKINVTFRVTWRTRTFWTVIILSDVLPMTLCRILGTCQLYYINNRLKTALTKNWHFLF